MDRFLPVLALYLIIAWRSFYVCRVSRTHEDEPCEILYSKPEWQSVWQKKPPQRPPGLMEMTKVMAQLGGYVNRKNSGPPVNLARSAKNARLRNRMDHIRPRSRALDVRNNEDWAERRDLQNSAPSPISVHVIVSQSLRLTHPPHSAPQAGRKGT